MYLCCSILRRTQSPENFFDSVCEIYMVRLPFATVNWHKSLQFVEKSNITLLIYDFYLPFRLLYYAWVLLFDRGPGFALRFPLPQLSQASHAIIWYGHKWIFTMYKDFCLRWIEKIKICASFTNLCFSGSEAVKSGLLLQRYRNF